MIVWGDSGGRYNPSSDTWRPVGTATNRNFDAPSLGKSPRSCAFWTGNEMILYNSSPSYVSIYDPVSDDWTIVDFDNQPYRNNYSATWTGKKLILWGGAAGYYSFDSFVSDSAVYDPAANTWEVILMDRLRTMHTAVWTGSEVIVWGGVEAPLVNDETEPLADPTLGTGLRYLPKTVLSYFLKR